MERSRRISNEWIWDWSVRPELKANEAIFVGSYDFKLSQNSQKKLSLRQWAIRRGLFSKEILSIFLLSNVLSLVLGAGIGYAILIRRSL